MPLIGKRHKINGHILALLLTLCFSVSGFVVSAQETSDYITVDLSDSPTATDTLTDILRDDTNPCTAEDGDYSPGTDASCVTFKLILHPLSAGISAQVLDGATPGSESWGINCNQAGPISEGLCLNPGEIVHYLTYCKSGNNPNTFRFGSLPNPDIFYTGVSTAICPDIIYIGEGFSSYSIESTATDSALKAEYESYLSCWPDCDSLLTSNVNSVEIIPSGDFPDSVEYVISGSLSDYDSPCVDEINAEQNFTIELYEPLSYETAPESGVYSCCEYKEYLDLEVMNVSGGVPFAKGSSDEYIFTWYDEFDGQGNELKSHSGVYSYYRIYSPGDYSVQIEDSNTNCDPEVYNFPVKTETELPVELISFEGSCKNGKAELKWTSAQEYYNDYYLLEKSADMKTFNTVERIEGKGFCQNMSNYSYTDNKYNPSEKYYRLSQVDFDGSCEVLESISLNCEDAESTESYIRISENPFSHHLKFELINISPDRLSIHIYDKHGNELYQETKGSGTNHQLNLGHLSPGMYVLQVLADEQMIVRKIIKQ
ncbi:MAG: T9SS type A sorting domain-containing protein [Bacteroidales bacterium]